MWKPSKPDDPKPSTIPAPAPLSNNMSAPKETRPVDTPRFPEARAELAHIGKSVMIKGELSGSEDLYLDGEVEGTIDLRSHSLTVGPNGRVRANTQAKQVVIHGKVNGNIQADRVELTKSALVSGDIITQRVVIEDGAFFKGAIDVQREQPKEAPKVEVRAAAAAAGMGIATPVAPTMQSSFVEAKK